MMRTASTKISALASALVATSVIVGQGCSSGFPKLSSNSRLVVTLTNGERGSTDKRLPISLITANTFTVRIEARKPDGSIDTGFTGQVRATSKPGSVLKVSGPGATGRNVALVGGVAEGVSVDLVGAYGDARLWFEDIGYVQRDPLGTRPPACSDGIDNDNDGVIDFPSDPGCAFADDDTEQSGTFATGATDPLYYQLPRISDLRGADTGGTGNPFNKQQVTIDTGYRGGDDFGFNVVVTRLAADGFYVTDVENDRGANKRGSSSIFAFTFNAPPRIAVCDRLRTLTGTSVQFFGFAELSFPTWLVEPWDQSQGPCPVPPPAVLNPSNVADQTQLFPLQSALVRAETANGLEVRVTRFIGKDFPEQITPQPPTFKFSETASNCDLNNDGTVDFYNDPEKSCSDQCTLDPECTEYSNFASRGDFKINISIAGKSPPDPGAKIQANVASAGNIRPQQLRGQKLRSFTGTLRYFSGGKQFTIEARCDQDVVINPDASPLPTNESCIYGSGSTNEDQR